MPEGKETVLEGATLDEAVRALQGWEVRDGWLRRKYATPGWPHTLMLANAIGLAAEAANHHPDLELGYAQVVVRLQTHKVHAITDFDVALAHRIEEIATWTPGAESPLPGYPKKWIH